MVENEEEGVVDLYDDEITEEDYGFVLDGEGELKSVFFPANYFEIPDKVAKILKIMGVNNPEDVQIHSVH